MQSKINFLETVGYRDFQDVGPVYAYIVNAVSVRTYTSVTLGVASSVANNDIMGMTS